MYAPEGAFCESDLLQCLPVQPALPTSHACPAGSQLMQIWDSLCHVLRARQISVEDVSNKVPSSLQSLLPLFSHDGFA